MFKASKMVGVFAGSFDPIHLGHLDIIKRSLQFCDELVIAIGVNPVKKTFLSEEKRIELINSSLREHKIYGVYVASFQGLLIDFVRTIDFGHSERLEKFIIRGVRSAVDFEYEANIANINKALAPDIETILLPTVPELMIVSSSMIKEISKHNGDVSKFVSVCVKNEMEKPS